MINGGRIKFVLGNIVVATNHINRPLLSGTVALLELAALNTNRKQQFEAILKVGNHGRVPVVILDVSAKRAAARCQKILTRMSCLPDLQSEPVSIERIERMKGAKNND